MSSKGYKHSDEAREKMRKVATGRIFSKEHKANLSKAAKGKIILKETRRKISIANKGYKHTEDAKRKISLAMKGNKLCVGRECSEGTRKKISIAVSGSSNFNWRGGIACEPYCDIWLDKDYRESIKERDSHTCQNPDCWGNCNHLPLHIHHIDNNKKHCDPWNLIILCNGCNSRAKFDREFWTNFYQEIMTKKYGYDY